jgi:hypothetical protein
LKRTTLIAAALWLAAGASNSIAQDKMEDGRKDAMAHDSMSKPAKHDKMDKMGKADKTDKMDKMGKADAMEKPGAMGKMDKMEKPSEAMQ